MNSDLEEKRRRMQQRVHPFIGHEGIGSRISAKKSINRLILKESPFSQLSVILGLLLFGPGLTALAISKKEDLGKTPWSVFAVMVFFSLIGWVFGLKYLARLLRGRRIEVSAAEGTVALFAGGRRPYRLVPCSEIEGLDVFTTWYSADSGGVENFTLRLKCKEGEFVELCTSDCRENIKSIEAILVRMTAQRIG